MSEAPAAGEVAGWGGPYDAARDLVLLLTATCNVSAHAHARQPAIKTWCAAAVLPMHAGLPLIHACPPCLCSLPCQVCQGS